MPTLPLQTIIEQAKSRARTWLEGGFEPEGRTSPQSAREDDTEESDYSDGDLRDFISDDPEDAEIDEHAASILRLQGRYNRVVMSKDRELVVAAVKYRLMRDIVACMPHRSPLVDFPSREDRDDLFAMDGRLRMHAQVMAETAASRSWSPEIMRLLRRHTTIMNEPLVLGAKCQMCGNKESDGNAHTLTLCSPAIGEAYLLVAGTACLKRAYICHLYLHFSNTIRAKCMGFLADIATDPALSPGQLYALAETRATLHGSLTDSLCVLWKNLRKSDDAVIEQNQLVWASTRVHRPTPHFEE